MITKESTNLVHNRTLTMALNLSDQSSRLGHEFIAGTMDSAEVNRGRGILLELLPKLLHVAIHGPADRIGLVLPNTFEELMARNYAPRMQGEILQDLELQRSQSNGPAAACGFHAGEIHGDIAEG